MSERTSSMKSESINDDDMLLNIDSSIHNEKAIAKWDPLCIRKRSNWSSLNEKYKMDDPFFAPDFFLKDMPHFSPKLVALLNKIKECDARDQKKYGTTFKHFIFSDIKSGGHGAKMLASALISTGWTLGYKSELKNREKFTNPKDENLEGGRERGPNGENGPKPQWGPLELLSPNELKGKDSFYLLSSVPIYDKPISVRMKKEILANFNSRPQNIYGDIARIIVMDSGFKEGIDLFDIKYIHIFEPSMNIADQKQVIGRGTRTCGQKGLEFHPTRGWPLNVFVYDMEIPEPLRLSLLGADSAYDLLMRAMNADIRIANFSYDMERLAVLGSVDYELNENVHQFEIDLSDENEDEEIVFGGSPNVSISSRSSFFSGEMIDKDFLQNIAPMGHKEMRKYIDDHFGQYKWSKVKMENLCGKLPDEWKRRSSMDSSPRLSELTLSSVDSSPSLSELSLSSEDSSREEYTQKETEIVPVSYLRERPIAEISTVSEKPLSSVVIKENISEPESLVPTEAETITEVVKKSPRKSRKSRVSVKKSSTRKSTRLTEAEPVSLLKGGASAVLEFTPTQAFVQHYFTPFCPVKGMLLYHSTGSGKTCSAIATATTNFEPMGYTILWVTRTTLKNDIWKNMFEQVCHKAIQERIMNGEKIPDTQKERMRLLSKEWRIRPMSYKQFSNLVSKKNAFYDRLVKENGEADPLRRTLLIIDEAHKLYGGGDLSSLERPDMEALHSALMNSYLVSGMDSVRVLLMTATPITENPMELVKLMNLCRPIDRQLPNTFESFAQEYLNEEGGFTTKGQSAFLDDIAGYISYLNREKDARQFSQPRIKKVMVPMVADIQMVGDFDKYVTRTEAENNVLILQKELNDIVGRLETELSGLSKKSFQDDFYQLCDKYPDLPKKKCQTIVNRNLTDLMRDVKHRIKTIREQIKSLKSEIASMKKGKIMKLEVIKYKIESSPELFEKYKSSTYYAIRNKCSSKTLEGTEFIKAVQQLPEVIEIDQQLQAINDTIATLENKIKIETVGLKGIIKDMKAQLKDHSIAPVQKMEIEHQVRDKQKEFRKIQKDLKADIQEEIKDEKNKVKKLEKEKKDIFKTVRKTLKHRALQKKKEEKEAQKAEQKLNKTRSLFEYKGELIELTDRRKELVERDITDALEELQEKTREKMKKQAEKQAEKKAKKTLKERDAAEEKERKKLAKLREKEQKEAEKQAKKTLKKRDAAEEKERKKLEKLREKQAETRKKQKGVTSRGLS
jgi:hypothetical protein